MIGLQPEALQTVFPFHFAFDRRLRVQQVGPSLAKLLPNFLPGVVLTDFFRVLTPSVPAEFAAIEQQKLSAT